MQNDKTGLEFERPPTDQEIIERFRAGEQQAFDELMRRYERRAIVLANQHLGDPALARDAVQEAFVSVFVAERRGAAMFDASQPFYNWFARIVINKCHDIRRRTHTESVRGIVELLGDEEEELPVEDGRPSPFTHAASHEIAEIIAACIQEFDHEQREAFELHHVSGWTFKQIAVVQECAPSTVKYRLDQAHKKIERRLKKKGIKGWRVQC